jgi:hypothetical protein
MALDAPWRFSSRPIVELAPSFVHEASPQALQQDAALLAQYATSLPASGMPAVVLLDRRLQVSPAAAPDGE